MPLVALFFVIEIPSVQLNVLDGGSTRHNRTHTKGSKRGGDVKRHKEQKLQYCLSEMDGNA